MKSKLMIATVALSLFLALPLLAQGQGGSQVSGSFGGAGGFDMSEMQKRMIERAVEENDSDDDSELSKEEFLKMAANERYSIWFEEDDSESEESSDEDAESDESDEATADASEEGEEGEEDSEEDALAKFHEAKFAEIDADDDGNVTVDELDAAIDFEAIMERMRDRWQRGGGNRSGGGNWQRPGGGGAP